MSPLIYHLEKNEKIKFNGKAHNDNFQSQYKSKKTTIQARFQKNPTKLVFARLAALGSLPFYKLEKSCDMQHLFREQRLKIPSSRRA